MMIRLNYFRQKWTSLGLAALLVTGLMSSVPQVSFANDWTDMLKPLVRDVIVPGASMGMKKLIQREQRLHPELAKTSNGSTTATTSAGMTTAGMDEFFNSSGSASVSTSSSDTTNQFASPEEPMSNSPISSSNVGGTAGSEFWAASHSVSATEPAPAPPPPVATP